MGRRSARADPEGEAIRLFDGGEIAMGGRWYATT